MTTTDTERRVLVSERALLGRINRRLAKDEEMMHKARPSQWNDVGNYYTVNYNRNWLAAYHINDLETWVRREMPDVLKPWEALAPEAD